MKKVFIVRLTETERSELEALVRKGKTSALAIARARILLKADQGEEGNAATDVEAALHRKKQACASRSRKLDGKAEAKLVATCCGPAPQGRTRWTLRMLAGKLVELEVVNSISPETVRRTLKKMRLSLG